MTREQLLQLWKQRTDAEDIVGASEIAAIIQGMSEGPALTQETLREDEAIADVAPFEPDLVRSPLPSVEPGVETARPPEDDSLSGRIFRGAEELLYPGRSTEWVNDALEGGLDRLAESEGEAITQGATDMIRDRNNWRMVGDVGGWAAATLGTLIQGPGVLEPASTAGQLAMTGPILASAGSAMMDGLYQQFMLEGVDINEMAEAGRTSLLWNTLFSGLPTMAGAVKDVAAKFLTGTLGTKAGRAAAEAQAWIDDIYQRYQMVRGEGKATPDPSAAGKSRAVTGFKVFGKMPVVVGTWFQVRRQQNISKSLDWWNAQLENLAPLVDEATLGMRFVNDARAMGKWMLESVTGLYDDMYKAAAPFDKKYADRGGIIPTNALKQYADDLLGALGSRLPLKKPQFSAEDIAEFLRTGVVPKKLGDQMSNFTADDWGRWVIENFSNVGTFTTMERIRNLKTMLSEAVRRTKNDPAQDTASLRGALRAVQDAMEEMRYTARTSGDDEFKAFAAKSEFVDGYFGEVMGLLERNVGQRFAAVDKDFWHRANLLGGYTNPGNKYADEMFEVAFNTNSKQYLQDLRALVGDQAYNQGRRKYLQDTFERAYVTEPGTPDAIFNVKKFRDLLQIDAKPGVFEELMKGSGISRKQMENFIANLGDYPITYNAAKMQMRRGMLGGGKAIMSGLNPRALGAIAGTSAASGGVASMFDIDWWKPVIIVMAIRAGGKIATSPWAFKQLTTFAEAEKKYFMGKISVQQYAQALDKVLRYFPETGEDTYEGPPITSQLGLSLPPGMDEKLQEYRSKL